MKENSATGLAIWQTYKFVSRNARKMGCCLIDRNGLVLDCNDCFGTMMDRDVSIIKNTETVRSLSAPEDYAKTDAMMAKLFSHASIISGVKLYVGPTGKRVPRHVESQSISEPDGSVRYAVSWLYPANQSQAEMIEIRNKLHDVAEQMAKAGPGVNVNVTGADNSNNASGGSTITINQQAVMWAALAVVALVCVVLTVAVLGGRFSATHSGGGQGTVTVESSE